MNIREETMLDRQELAESITIDSAQQAYSTSSNACSHHTHWITSQSMRNWSPKN